MVNAPRSSHLALMLSVVLAGACAQKEDSPPAPVLSAAQEQRLLETETRPGAETRAPVAPATVAGETIIKTAGGPAATEGPSVVPSMDEAREPHPIREIEREATVEGLDRIRTPGAVTQPAPAGALDGTLHPGGTLRSVRARSADGTESVTSALAGTTTPAPSFQFSTPASLQGGHPADAHMAAGFSHVCVTARDRVGCYTKGGRAVRIDPSSANDLTGETFFSSVIASNDGVFDMRAMYDQFRSRFWIVGLAVPSNRVVVAVSRSDNPRNGWNKYWLSAWASGAPNNGSTRFIDYPIIGIDSKAFYVSNAVVSVRDCDGSGSVSPADEKCFAYTMVNLRDAQQMADGVGGGSLNSWVFWDLTLPDGNLAGITPVVHETSTSRGYLLANYGADKISVFAINNPLTTSQSVSRIEAPIAAFGSTWGLTGAQKPNASTSTPGHNPAPRVKFDNLGNVPLNAHFRSNKIVFTANDSWAVNGKTRAAARVTRLNVANFGSGSVAVEVDRRFGVASAGDTAGSAFDYGWPAAGININGDMAIMTLRTDVSIFPQLRMSAWGATDTDLRSSILTQASTAALYPFDGCCDFQAWVDTSGVSTDPYDDAGIYFAQEWGSGVGFNNYRIQVAKEFGTVLPDIAADSLTASSSTIARGASVTLTMRAVNQGDASMPASTGQWYLSTNNVISTTDTALGSTFLVPSVAVAGVSASIAKAVTIPSGTAPGTYYLGACLDTSNVASEYRESSNNCNSGSSTSPSLAPIQVTIN